MLYKGVIAAIWATVLSASLVEAQSLAQIGGPANLPPRGFTGQQFVDNRGCVFLRAGFGATVNWVPRIDRLRRPLCGFPPTFGAEVVAAVEADMAPDPQAKVATTAPLVAAPAVTGVAVASPPMVAAAAPAAGRMSLMQLLFGTGTSRTVTPATISEPAPVVVPVVAQVAAPMADLVPPQPSYTSAALAGLQPGQVQCFGSTPKLERVLLRNGGTALVCTAGDGTMTGWRSPLFARNAGVGAALGIPNLTAQMMVGATLLGSGQIGAQMQVANVNSIPTPPRGYKVAWKDDRLNPLRGVGTSQGQAQQDQVWTRDVPAVLVLVQTQTGAQTQAGATAVNQTQTVSVSTMSAPATQLAHSFVQVGTFGQPENAEGAKTRLAALGLPVSTSKITRNGKILQIVYAGPFGSAADAQAALVAARSAGFKDAILR